MEISNLGPAGFLIKTKAAALTVKPNGELVIENQSGPIVIAGPGEYEVSGFSVVGYKGGGYLIEAEEVSLGYLTAKESVEVLFTDSWEMVKNIQPRIVIPVDEAAAADLVKASGLEKKPEKKLLVNKVSLPEETELVILERKA